ncbi:hypothetical protein KBC70_01945 [Candidatus Woesebacteria bacterium]|nr:hypothetical protein [Candidatus Woesebacteria bacterium]
MLPKRIVMSTELINRLGFSFIYLLATYLGSSFLFIAFYGFSMVSLGIGSPVSPGLPLFLLALVAGIAGLVIGLLTVIGITKVIQKVTSIKTFAMSTFFILLCTHIIGFLGLFTIHHHVFNPAFYLLVVSYLSLMTALLTYLWKTLILKNSKTNLPWKVYGLSFLLTIISERYVLSHLADNTYSKFHDFLFDRFLINIYFLDWSGYWELMTILTMLISLSIVTKLLYRK